MNRFSFAKVCALALGCSTGLLGASTVSAQTLVGDTVELWAHPQSNGNLNMVGSSLVVSPGFEFEQVIINPISTFNIEATSIRFDAVDDFYGPYFNSGFDPTYYEIRDLDFIGEPDRHIVGVNVSFATTIGIHEDTPMGWPQFSAANVTFTADSVRLSIGGYEFPTGSWVEIELITAVPAPAALGVIAIGGLFSGRRRRN